jgi:branched-chain amino acid transport system permease protein
MLNGNCRRGGIVVLAIIAIAVTPFVVGDYVTSLLVLAAIYALLVTGLNLFMGFTGQVSFGHNAFVAVGAYVSAILTSTYGWPPLLALVASLFGTVIVAMIAGYPTLRLRGHYLAMGTLALGLMVVDIATHWDAVTRGTFGISGIPPLGIGGLELSSDRQYFYVYWALAGASILATWRLRHARFGRALCAIGGDEHAARGLGVDVTRYKLMAFIVSAAFAGLAGSLFAFFVSYISPEIFGLYMVATSFTMLYVGGIGTTFGPVIGAVVVTLVPEALRGVNQAREISYGVLLLLILLFAPRGLSALSEIRWRPSRSSSATVPERET